MINIQKIPQITKIYLVTNCYGDPNKVYIGKEKFPKCITTREINHRCKFGKNIIFTYIDEVNSYNKEHWTPIESFWIEQFNQWGFEIQNKNKGGGGPSGHTEESLLKIRKPVLQYDINNIFIKKWNSALEAHIELGVNVHSISSCCNYKKIKMAGGFIWRFENDPLPPDYKLPEKLTSSKPIIQYNLNGDFIKEWKNTITASKTLGINPPSISGCLRGISKSGGKFKWSYK